MGDVLDYLNQQKYKDYIENFIRNLNIRVTELENSNKILKEEIVKLKKERNISSEKKPVSIMPVPAAALQESVKNTVSAVQDNIIEMFNQWARDPLIKLPPTFFYYVDGELKLREKQKTVPGNSFSLWIMNKTGTRKYLFPNPDAIDQIGGDIDVIYTVNGIRRARGQNKVAIQKACEIKEDGWIEYKGTLNLL